MIMSAGTDKGIVRSVNQDSYCFCQEKTPYMAIADGMGGHKSGEIASKIAIECVQSFLTEDKIKNSRNIKKCLTEAINAANDDIYKKSSQDEKFSGMGTTLVISYFKDNLAYIANVGDSRAYIIRDNKIEQITKDHSIVQELYESGKIKFSDMRNHPRKNYITRAVGTNTSVECDIFEVDLQKDDVIFLCSDGLTNMLEDEQILNVFLTTNSIDAFVSELIDKANEAGGHDNITVAIAKL